MNPPSNYKLKKSSLEQMLRPRARKVAFGNEQLESFSPQVSEREFTPTIGYHIYADIRLKLKITAGDSDDSRRYLQIIQDCVTAADKCAGLANARLLEVQFDKLHFVIEADAVTAESYTRLTAFCSAFTYQVFTQIIPRDPNAWDGFAMAADHGPSIVIHPDWDSSDSLVSLGVAANTPAKKLYQTPTVASGKVAINQNIYRPNNNDLAPQWKEFTLYSHSGASEIALSNELNEKMAVALAKAFDETGDKPLIKLSNATDFLRQFAGNVNSPSRVQGFYFRADMDGFTAKVKSAFAQKTETAIEQLVRDFYTAMKVTKDFETVMTKRRLDVLSLPWAGDCANLIVFPKDQSYQSAQQTVPFASSLAWHELEASNVDAARKWAVAIGGGSQKEGSNGALLVAQVHAEDRSFLVAAGWGAKRSHDAQQSDGLHGTETAMHEEDVSSLNSQFQKAFTGSGLFKKATLQALKKAQEESTSCLANAKSFSMPAIITKVPAPKPHFAP